MRTSSSSPGPVLLGISIIVAALSVFSITQARSQAHHQAVALIRTRHTAVGRTISAGPRAAPAAHSAVRHRPRPKASQHTTTSAALTLARMVGQQLMVRMDGTSPDGSLLARIREGQVGGVILYADNIASESQLRSLVAELQDAAKAGGNPPLLISTDQEGGPVKRLPWAGPDLSPPQMGNAGPQVSQNEGEQTGAALRSDGINVDLAPVVDVAHSPAAFIWRQDRSFGMTAASVIDSAIPFGNGLQLAGVAPTAKHFPGVGGATADTDYSRQTIISQREDLAPYRALIVGQIPIIMVSTAVYSNLDPSVPAALSQMIITGLLRHTLGYDGVVMTDDLERPTGYTTSDAAERAAAAGADIILVSTTESAGSAAYGSILAAAERGSIPLETVRTAYQRIRDLKQRYASYAAN